MHSGLLDTTHLNWKLAARMRDSVNGKIEMEVGTEKLEREKVGSEMFLGKNSRVSFDQEYKNQYLNMKSGKFREYNMRH